MIIIFVLVYSVMDMHNSTFVIGISGAVGSGKSWFASRLKKSLSDTVCVFTLDSYSKSEKFVNNLEFRYDNPQAIDYNKAYADLSKLLHGGSIKLPVYDYVSHSAIAEELYNAPSVIIIEGLYSFYDKRFLDVMDIKIWIEVDEDVCMERRINRDIQERGVTKEEAISRHINDSKPAFEKFYNKGKALSDCVYFNVQTLNDVNPLLINLITNFYEKNKL